MISNPEDNISVLFLEQNEQGHLVHDMKSPYNGIVGLSEPMAKMAKEADKKKQLTWLNVSGARWCKYIEAAVESKPMSEGMLELKNDPLNLGFLAEEACALLSMAKDPHDKPMKNEAVTISNTVPCEGLTATGSDMHTAKCIFHLLLNAVKFTDLGTITLSHRTEGESHIVLIITDTGIGMSPDEISLAFDPFVKFSDRFPGESLGLGLTSTKEYIEFAGGKVILQSEAGKGTTAELWIPRVASNIGSFYKGPLGFGYFMFGTPIGGPWLLQKRALGILAVDILPAHYGIAGMADLLVNNEQKPQAKKQFGMIQRSANRVVEVLSLIRDATLRSEPPLVPRSVAFTFGPMMEDIIAELNKALDKRGQPMKKKTVDFIYEPSGQVPVILADPFYVYRIVYQLCDNALKFTNEGKVLVSADLSGNNGLVVTVSDTGIGFDMGKLEEIFKPLHRLEPEKFYGLGIGLCMVKDMVARLAGSSIEFSSTLGKGTTVTLLLGEGTAMQSNPEVPVAKDVTPEVTAPPPSTMEAPGASAAEVPSTQIEVAAPPVVEPAATIAEKVEKPEISQDPLQEPVAPVSVVPDSVATEPPKEEPKGVKFDEKPSEPASSVEVAKSAPQEPETLQFVFADMPKDDEDQEIVKRKTLAGDKYRILVEMDDGSEPPSIQSALGSLSLAVEILKERIAVANATSNTIKSLIKVIDAKYH
jgi:signal transduction histidine kinase